MSEEAESSNDAAASISSVSESEQSDGPDHNRDLPEPTSAAEAAPHQGLILKWYAADLKPPVKWSRVLQEMQELAWWPSRVGGFFPNVLGQVVPASLYMSCKGMKNLFHLAQHLLHISASIKLEGWNALPHMLTHQRTFQQCEFNCFSVLRGRFPGENGELQVRYWPSQTLVAKMGPTCTPEPQDHRGWSWTRWN